MVKIRKDLETPELLEYLQARLSYDPETGHFTWRERPVEDFVSRASWITWNKRFAGKRAGSKSKVGYYNIGIGWKVMRAHRMVFAFVNGYWPEGQVDHSDIDPTNDRPGNLRERLLKVRTERTVDPTRTQSRVSRESVDLMERGSGKRRLGIMGFAPTSVVSILLKKLREHTIEPQLSFMVSSPELTFQ